MANTCLCSAISSSSCSSFSCTLGVCQLFLPGAHTCWQPSTLLSGLWCPEFLCCCRTAGLWSSSVLGRLSHTPQLITLPKFGRLLSNSYISAHIHGYPRKGLRTAPSAPRPLWSFLSAQNTNAYLSYVWCTSRKQRTCWCVMKYFTGLSFVFNNTNRWWLYTLQVIPQICNEFCLLYLHSVHY